MQRLQIAFLQRKALGNATISKGSWDKLSLPLVAVFIWLVFLFSSCSGHVDPHKDAFCNLVHKTCPCEDGRMLMRGPFPVISLLADMCSVPDEWIPESTSPEHCEQKNQTAGTTVKGQVEGGYLNKGSEKDIVKSDRLVRDVTPGFDEFKTKAVNPREKPGVVKAGSDLHRVEPGGKEYNYASASKGSKVLAFNKEAKGAPNILGKDMDKYLRNPCSAEGKFVVVELSEETLVVTIELANFEHYSSNFKDFELLGSLVYPTETWMKLGNFTAKNVKQSQRFTLQEPKWVRYLKISLLSHYGSEFYCTLSVVQVYGVDAVERMLEDLISAQDNVFVSDESSNEQKSNTQQSTVSQSDDHDKTSITYSESAPEVPTKRRDASNNNGVGERIDEVQPQPVGRMPGDSVLKILMQKVRSLDINLSLLERYLEELNGRYGNRLKDFGKDFEVMDGLLEKMREDVVNLINDNEARSKDVEDILSWKSLVSLQMDNLNRENTFLRTEVEKIVRNQAHMENKGLVALLVSLVCILLTTIKVIADIAVSIFKRKHEYTTCSRVYMPSIFLLAAFTSIIIILLL